MRKFQNVEGIALQILKTGEKGNSRDQQQEEEDSLDREESKE